MLDEQWALLLETIETEFRGYVDRNIKLKATLPSGKNLAML
jgi:hypothetical protein